MSLHKKNESVGFRRMMVFLFTVLFILGSGVCYSSEKNDKAVNLDWPQWRGQNRDGISPIKDILNNWEKVKPETLWRTPVGDGYSGIVVSNDKLFTMWDEEDSQFLFCLDALNGKELWRFRIGDSFTNQYGNGPRSTPVVDEASVYTISTHGFLVAVDIQSGKLQWSHNLAAEYGSQIPSIGYSSSPLVGEDKLYVEIGGKKDFAFAAFNKNTGDLIWHSQSDLPAYSSPIMVTINGKRQIVFLSADGLFSLSPENGNLYWRHSWQTRCPSTDIPLNTATPIFIAPDKIFISSGYGTVSGATVVQIQETDDKFKVETLWTTSDMQNLVNSSVFFDGHIYGFDSSILKSVNALTGEEKWKGRGFQRGSLIVAGDYLVVLGERGKLALVEATPEAFREITSIQALDGKCWTSPSLANGKLYLRNNKEMICLDIREK